MTFVLKKSENCDLTEIKILFKNSCKQVLPDVEIFTENFDLHNEIVWDFLGVNIAQRIVLVKFVENHSPEIFYNTLKHFTWTKENLDLIAKIYQPHKIDLTLVPKINIFAKSFSLDFKKIISTFHELNIELIAYKVLESEFGRGILFENENLSPATGNPNEIQNDKMELTTHSNLEELTPEEMLDLLN